MAVIACISLTDQEVLDRTLETEARFLYTSCVTILGRLVLGRKRALLLILSRCVETSSMVVHDARLHVTCEK